MKYLDDIQHVSSELTPDERERVRQGLDTLAWGFVFAAAKQVNRPMRERLERTARRLERMAQAVSL